MKLKYFGYLTIQNIKITKLDKQASHQFVQFQYTAYKKTLSENNFKKSQLSKSYKLVL